MERFEVPIDDRLAELVERAARGDEVVIVQGGKAVAQVRRARSRHRAEPSPLDLKALEALRARLPLLKGDAAHIIRAIRDDEAE